MTDAPPRNLGRRLAIGVSAGAVLVAALDAYVVVTILVTIVRDLRIPINRLERATPIITGYLVGYVAAMPLLGRLSDRVGRRTVIQSCLAGFAVGSIVSALAGNLPQLVVGRLVQGAAGGALLPVAFALVGDLWEAPARALPLGVLGGAQELGSVIGPLTGAALAAAAGWRSVFWINVPLAVVAAVAIHRAVPRDGAEATEATESRPTLGLAGGGILAASLALVVAGLYNPDPARGVLAAWGAWTLGLGILGLAGFAVWDRLASSPLLDWRLVARRPFAAALGASFASGAVLMVTLVDVPLIAQTLLGRDTLGGALVLLRFLIALPVGAVAGGQIAGWIGERATSLLGFAIAAAGYWLIATWPLAPGAARYAVGPVSLPQVDTALAVAGAGLGLVIAPLASVTLRSVASAQHGVASAAVVLTRMMGMLIGISVLAAEGLHRFQVLTARLAPPLPFGVDSGVFQRRVAQYERALSVALHTEYREVFLITSVLCAAAVITSLGLGRASRTSAPVPVAN